MKKMIAVAVVALLMAAPAMAQQKFGHIDSAELVELMPEKTAAEKNLQDLAKELEGQLKLMAAEYETKVGEFQKTEKSMTETLRNTKIKEIGDMEKRIQEFQGSAQQELQKKEEELMAPLIDKVKKAITDVAVEKGYTYIFDESMGVLLYAKESESVLVDVKKKLGL
jgi:outer membrane protein